MTTATHNLPEFSAEGKRLIGSDGRPTKAGDREIKTREIMARGADRAEAERLACLSLFRTKRGGWAYRHADSSLASPLTARSCGLLGLECGPGND